MSGGDIKSSATTAINRRGGCHSGVVNRCCWATVEACSWSGGGGGALCDWITGDAAVGCCGGQSDESSEDGESNCEMHGGDESVDDERVPKVDNTEIRSWL